MTPRIHIWWCDSIIWGLLHCQLRLKRGVKQTVNHDTSESLLELKRGENIILDTAKGFYCSLSWSCHLIRRVVRDNFTKKNVSYISMEGIPSNPAWFTLVFWIAGPGQEHNLLNGRNSLPSVRELFFLSFVFHYINPGLILALGIETIWLYIP